MTTILVFTSPQVQRLTGLTAGRLDYWDRTGVYQPTYKDDRPHRAYRRVYTFRDVVGLRTLVELRDKFGVSLDELRKTGEHLKRYTDEPWSKRFWVVNRRVLFQLPETESIVDRHGQSSFVDMGAIWSEIQQQTESWIHRDQSDSGKITRHRHVQHNKWVIKGTRIPTVTVWKFHKAGFNPEEIIQQYPTLTQEDIKAAIAHEESKESNVKAA